MFQPGCNSGWVIDCNSGFKLQIWRASNDLLLKLPLGTWQTEGALASEGSGRERAGAMGQCKEHDIYNGFRGSMAQSPS